ncbi:MAG TPA: cupin domain-containing protein [Polyangiaceae bacterium]|nr:cupin domain-containing protein [Polyangiaceae bacterium]
MSTSSPPSKPSAPPTLPTGETPPGAAPPPARLALADARVAPLQPGRASALLLEHGSLEVRFYAPRGVDLQTPHGRDELYVVASGRGWFMRGGERVPFEPGDALFVRAGVEHRFENFDDDFAAWVFFYGPEGGEAPDAYAPRGALAGRAQRPRGPRQWLCRGRCARRS